MSSELVGTSQWALAAQARLAGKMGDYLASILAAHRAVAARDRRDLSELVERARHCPPVRGFAEALKSAKGPSVPAVIAELKRRSPSRGVLAPDLVPGTMARLYADCGAACLSVLTDAEFFGGSAADLAEARAAVDLPVLRKDFAVSLADVCDARLMGADALLLIVRALSATQLRDMLKLAAELGLDALVEVHDQDEAQIALREGATLIGVNQRDLGTFEVDPVRAARVAKAIPSEVLRVAESGVRTALDVERLVSAGFDAVLVGEALVASPDPKEAFRQLFGAEVRRGERAPCS
ncbi:MAG: indole-3-glycerol phosphate synthase TrpC [Acidimicrobiales bacterium]